MHGLGLKWYWAEVTLHTWNLLVLLRDGRYFGGFGEGSVGVSFDSNFNLHGYDWK